MKLLMSENEVVDPTRDAVLGAIGDLEEDQTITLAKSDSEFLDAYCIDPASFNVQYREGTLEEMWAGPAEGVDAAMLARLFSSYLAGNDEWRRLVAWEHAPM